MTNKNYKFKGGLRVGLWANSWPNGILEVSQNSLIFRDKMLKKEYKFSKDQIGKIEIKKLFPIIGYGIRIHHRNENYNKKIYFWYVSLNFNKLISALKEFGWK